MLRIVGICLALFAVALAVYSTITQTQPALFFIEWTTIYGKFPLSAVMLITALVLLIPIVILFLIAGKLKQNKDFMPDLKGQSGLVVVRKKALYNGLYLAKVLIDTQIKSAVSNGKSS